MPTDSDNGYLMVQGVVWQGLQSVELTTTTLDEDDCEFLKFVNQMQFEGTIRIKPEKMTRKRFKKLLMAKGIYRDAAEAYCDLVVKSKQTYQHAYLSIVVFGSLPLSHG